MNIRYEKIPQVFIERFRREMEQYAVRCTQQVGHRVFRLVLYVHPPIPSVLEEQVNTSTCTARVQEIRFRATPRYAVPDPWYAPEQRRLAEVTIEPYSDADLDAIIHHSLMLRAEEPAL